MRPKMDAPDRIRVFIAYSHHDEKAVQRLAAALEDLGLDPWWDQHLQPGVGFTDTIQRFISHAHVFLPVITQVDGQASRPWVLQEIGFAVGRHIPVLPICIGVNPEGLIAGIQAIRADSWPVDPEVVGRQVEVLAEQAVIERSALYESAPEILDRARMLAEHADFVRHNQRLALVRQKAVLGTFSIPDEHENHPDWTDRYQEEPRTPGARRVLREERRALEKHARKRGCSLIVDFHRLTNLFAREAAAVRFVTLKAFLEDLPAEVPVGIGVLPERAASAEATPPLRSEDLAIHVESTTALGNWFLAESIRASLDHGWERTMFTTHTPTVQKRISQFDEELGLLLARQPGGFAGSRRHAIDWIDDWLNG